MGARRTIGWLLALVICAFATRAQAQKRDEVEARIEAELGEKGPDAVATFRAANAARDAKDLPKARALYGEVMQKAPAFAAAPRRACGVEEAMGHRAEAITLCREALRLEDSAFSLSALAGALALPPRSGPEENEAKTLVGRAVGLAPSDPSVLYSACDVGLKTGDIDLVRKSADKLTMLGDTTTTGDLCRGIGALAKGDRDEAEARLAHMKKSGAPPEAVAVLERILDDSRPWIERYGLLAGKIALAWIAGFALLLAAGFALSRTTLRWVARSPGSEAPSGLRRAYRTVLWLCCGYYYLSIPIVLASVVALVAGIIIGVLTAGFISIKLILIGLFLVFGTLSAVAKSLFVRRRNEDPGLSIDLDKHPDLAATLEEVAERIGTPRVDRVFLVPGAELAVFERASLLGQLRGKGERCLIIGAGAIQGMRLHDFKAVLAHEYGHLRNADTAGGGFALQVRRSLLEFAMGLAKGGVATWYNPAWWFVRGFDRVFLTISQGASRLQEILADRWAARAYGAAAFERGLRHVVKRSVKFGAHVDATLREIVTEKAALANLYAYKPGEVADTKTEVEKAINRAPSAYDSHPSPAQRFAYVAALGCVEPPPREDDQLFVWKLFTDRNGLEEALTDIVRALVAARRGVVIPRPTKKVARPEKPEEPGADAS